MSASISANDHGHAPPSTVGNSGQDKWPEMRSALELWVATHLPCAQGTVCHFFGVLVHHAGAVGKPAAQPALCLTGQSIIKITVKLYMNLKSISKWQTISKDCTSKRPPS